MSTPVFSQSLEHGRARFERGEFLEAHDAWEVGWRLTRGTERQVLQALVQWAVALEQLRRGKRDGAKRLLTRAMQRVGSLDEGFEGLDLPWLEDALLQSWAHLEGAALHLVWPPPAVAGPDDVVLDHRSACPSCGEPVEISVAPEDSVGARYVEDCPVCCRPWEVAVHLEGGQVRVTLERHDG